MNLEELQAFAASNPMLSLAFVGLTLAIVITEIALLFRSYTALKPADLTRLINSENALVLDLSPSSDFERGHIAGSRSVIESKFDPESKLLLGAKQSPLVVVCRNGHISAAAAKRLKKAGFEKVYWLDGGIATWKMAEMPLIKGRT
ncbi:rhodanese-like domain-containing protein [Xylella taiwanensis]|uniref:Rhodanese-like domain-containing protein n=1 Tax=Xylella taiwanensis TaxID=1444770 RepID=Z9JIJ8_9GAMM|nr:rhodanese-like domain-containing protein [Xylella taiwanensis]AXI83484.1 membrane protein [Xylella taiwanensis]EWS77994.1 sulfurtransferase [Xylella taiwanensis]MCD8456559.1 rhodanese-like domain-containing protein [Xylella taiwanensis]MCD8458966.1 rhodanese-like domain-containing protein [Xylella taiwanensis]MCD8461104.1 rhodanese-like domain-containing protein [Xylella taiwanensis]